MEKNETTQVYFILKCLMAQFLIKCLLNLASSDINYSRMQFYSILISIFSKHRLLNIKLF